MRLPSEDLESKALVRWLSRQEHLLFSHIPHETPTDVRNAKRNKHMGVRRGVPDYLIVEISTGRVFFVELKRRKPAKSAVSKHQKRWLAALRSRGCVCYGSHEAKRAIKSYFNHANDNPKLHAKRNTDRAHASARTPRDRARARVARS